MQWGIREGRNCAAEVDAFLNGSTRLAQPGGIPKRSFVAPPVKVTVKPVSSGSSSGTASDGEEGGSDVVGMDAPAAEVLA